MNKPAIRLMLQVTLSSTKFPEARIWNSENEKHFVGGRQFDTRNSLLCQSLIKTEIEVVCTQQDAFAVASQHPLSLPPPEAAAGSWRGPGCQKREHGAQQSPSLNVPAAASGRRNSARTSLQHW